MPTLTVGRKMQCGSTTGKRLMNGAKLVVPGMTFGERQALAHYARQAEMTVPDLVRECVREMAWQIAWLHSDDEKAGVR